MLGLLAGHWGAVKALTDAGGRSDKVATNRAMIALMDNAGEIAIFLSGASPKTRCGAGRPRRPPPRHRSMT